MNMELMIWFFTACTVGCVAAWIILLAKKLGGVEWLAINGNAFFSKMALCDYCLSWWLSVCLSVVLAVVAWEWTYVLVPFVSTVIARRMI